MNFVITKECHSRCQYCEIWKIPPQKNELTLAEIEKTAANYPYLSWIGLSGGEPTDRSDLREIAQAFVNKSDIYMLNFSTNGLNVKRILSQVEGILSLDIPKLVVAVSIDGPSEMHDQLRGINGNFELALQTTRELFALKRRYGGKTDLQVFVAATIFPENAHALTFLGNELKAQIPGFTKEHLHLNLGQRSRLRYDSDRKVEFQTDLQEEISRFHAQYPAALSFEGLLTSTFQRMISEYLRTTKTPIECSALKSSFYLDEKGWVYPCTIWDRPLGNVRDHHYSLKEILNSAESASARAEIRQKDCPNCWTPCEAYQSIAAAPVRSFLQSFLVS